MPIRRDALALTLPALAGADVIRILDKATGWPAIAEVRTSKGAVPVAMYVGPIGLSQRGRDDVERRFQNPGSNRPIVTVPGRMPLLIGVWDEGGSTIFAGMETTVRLGRTTRHSLFVPL